MKKFALIGIAALAVVAYAADVLTVDKLLKDRDDHDGKDVVVTGKVADFRERESRAGNKYTTFKIQGENKIASVYVQGVLDPTPKNGDTVEVSAVFRKEKKVNDNFTVKDELDATKKANKKYGVKITKKAASSDDK